MTSAPPISLSPPLGKPGQPACLFAYGTLQPDLAPPEIRPVVRHLRYLGDGSLPGILYDLGDYPGATFDAGAATGVHGRVYALPPGDDATLLAALDAYEGVDLHNPPAGLYQRRRVAVTLADGRLVDCWAYAYNRPTRGHPVIGTGVYIRRSPQMP